MTLTGWGTSALVGHAVVSSDDLEVVEDWVIAPVRPGWGGVPYGVYATARSGTMDPPRDVRGLSVLSPDPYRRIDVSARRVRTHGDSASVE